MSSAGFSATRLERTRSVMHKFVESGDVAGCITLVWRNGEIARVDTLGTSDSGAFTPMTRDTVSRCFHDETRDQRRSPDLVEEGRIAFDDPVARWLPELANPRCSRTPPRRSIVRNPLTRPSPCLIC